MDVPAKLATWVRMLSTGHGRKNDEADAVSVGIAALTAPGLRSAGGRAGHPGAARAGGAPR
jgi:transposase